MTSADLLSWLGEASLVLAFAVLLVLAARFAARGRLGAVWIYALWAAVPAALLASLAPNGLAPLPLGFAAPNVGAGASAVAAAFGAEAAGGGGVTAGRIAVTVWLLGAGGFVAANIAAQWRFHRTVVRAARGPDGAEARALAEAAAGTALRPVPDFRFTPRIAAPLACGLVRPVVLLPEGFLADYGPQDRRIMVLHEAEHVRARHIAHRAVAALVRCLFWFHPLAWIGERALAADQELACDAAVLGRERGLQPGAYAGALLNAASRAAGAPPRAPAGAVPLITLRLLKERTDMLTRHKTLGRTRAAGLSLAAAVSAAALLAGLSASAAPAAAGDPGTNASPDRDASPSRPVPPVYPEQAFEAGLEGECVMVFDVGADGVPRDVEAQSCTDAMFEQPSVDAVQNWRYDTDRALSGVQTMIAYQLDE